MKQSTRVWTRWWPLLLIGVFVLLIAARGLGWVGPKESKRTEDLMPLLVPAARFFGGVALLSPDRWIALTVMAPNEESTPVAAMQTHAQVDALLGGDAAAVLLAVPTGEAMAVQAALLDEKTRLVYRPIEGEPLPTVTATATPASTVAPTPDPALPTATPLPGKGRVYWPLPAELAVVGRGLLHADDPARLVIVTEPVPVAGTPIPAPPFAACVRVVLAPEAGSLLLELPAAGVAQAIQAADLASRVELLYDLSCKFE